MLDTWNESIFSNIKNRLQDSAMKLVHAERLGEAFDSQLVIGVRESYGEQQLYKICQRLHYWRECAFCDHKFWFFLTWAKWILDQILVAGQVMVLILIYMDVT